MGATMKDLQEATERICDLKGSVLAMQAFMNALARVLPASERVAWRDELLEEAEIVRVVLLNGRVSEHTCAAFERDTQQALATLERPTGDTHPPG